MYRKKTFREKLADAKDFPRVEPLTGGMKRRFGPGTIVLPAIVKAGTSSRDALEFTRACRDPMVNSTV